VGKTWRAGGEIRYLRGNGKARRQKQKRSSDDSSGAVMTLPGDAQMGAWTVDAECQKRNLLQRASPQQDARGRVG